MLFLSVGGADLALELLFLRIDVCTGVRFECVSPPSLVEAEPVEGVGWTGGVTLGC